MELLIEKASKNPNYSDMLDFLTPFLFFSQNQILSANIGRILHIVICNKVILHLVRWLIVDMYNAVSIVQSLKGFLVLNVKNTQNMENYCGGYSIPVHTTYDNTVV